MPKRVNIIIAEPSIIIRSGLVAVLKGLNTLSLKITEVEKTESLYPTLKSTEQDILIINPSYLGLVSPDKLKTDCDSKELKIIALQNNFSDENSLKLYNESLSIYDSSSQIQDKLESIINTESGTNKNQLSTREKEIVALIAKGLSNKEISDKLYVSTHTVMTHRRNIMNKLKIHSPAGLTIYAIVNKIIDISEVKDLL